MKKISIILGALILLSFEADQNFTVKFSAPSIEYHWKNLNTIKQIVDESNLSHQQVKFITSAIDSIQRDINAHGQLDTTKIRK